MEFNFYMTPVLVIFGYNFSIKFLDNFFFNFSDYCSHVPSLWIFRNQLNYFRLETGKWIVS